VVATGRSVNFTVEIIGRAATPFNFIIRSNDAEDAPEKENKRLCAAPWLYQRVKAQEEPTERHLSRSFFIFPLFSLLSPSLSPLSLFLLR
jgi:hypothetical protein